MSPSQPVMKKGRFAPSPTGRMHLGNVAAALMSWLSAKRDGGRWVLRIEDLDPQRSRYEYARMIEDDLHWLGLDWDEGGLDNIGDAGPYRQSERAEIYEKYLRRLEQTGLTYTCRCRRSDIMSTQAPHQSDGRIVYRSTCRPERLGGTAPEYEPGSGATRIFVPDREIVFRDRICGEQCVNLAEHCGDFILRRRDGAWAYQLAVVVDDALMGITEVVRGEDLLLSAAQQIYLYDLLEFDVPEFCHIPLVRNQAGQRLSKRDGAMSMEVLRTHFSPTEILGRAAVEMRLIPKYQPVKPQDLLAI